MNPEYIAANLVHTIPEKLSEYFLEPFTNFIVIFCLTMMFANVYMFRKLRNIKARDYMLVINIVTIGIYSVFGIISAVLVSRLEPHGTLTLDDCDKTYMFIPRTLFVIVSVINSIYFIVNLITKLKKDKEYNETVKRGYYAEENHLRQTEDKENKHTNHIDMSSFVDNIKEKIDIEGIKDKVNHITEDVKDIINSKKD